MLADKTNTKLVPFFPQNLPENRVKFSVFGLMLLFTSTNVAAVTTGANWHWCVTLKAACSLKSQNAGQRTKKVVPNSPGLVVFQSG